MKQHFVTMFVCLALFGGGVVFGQAVQAPYTEGSVWDVQFVRTKAGFSDDYLKSLGSTWKKVVDEEKKQGLVLSYRVLKAQPNGKDDWDVMLMIEYKNHAAFDGMDAKFRAVAAKAIGNDDAQRTLSTKRLEIRELLGGKIAQEVILK